jgi:copper transport protein
MEALKPTGNDGARLVVGAGLALALLLLTPAAAQAHALVVRSDPPAGAGLSQVPSAVTITFSEAPEPVQSDVQVFDESGKVVSRGAARPVPDNRLQLAVPLAPLLNGVYTVRWKTVSADDGHASTGSYTFGVGPSAYAASAGPAPALAAPPTSTSPLVVAGHWVFYAGLGLLVGGAWVSLFALRGASRRLLLLTLLGAFAMLAGLGVYGLAQARADGTPLVDVLATSLGLGLVAQALPGLAATACVEVALWRGGRPRSAALALATLLAAVTILVHVLTTHAAASHLAWLMVGVQWLHLASFAAWIGGLGALLVAVGSRPSPDKAAAVRRFSGVAAASLVVVGVTGLLRALDEVAAWSALANSLFGQLVLVKVGLLAVLASLGAINRLRSVPAAERTLAGLRRVGRVELGVAAVTLIASAMLTSLVPPALVRAAAKQPEVPRLVSQSKSQGNAAAVRGTLMVSPGYPGPNRFTLRFYDARASRTVVGDATLRFRMPSRPEVAESALALRQAADGSYAGVGSNVSLIGDWSIRAVVQTGAGPIEVPFQVTSRQSPQQLNAGMTMGNTPMVHGLRLAKGWYLDAYLTPGRTGRNTLHLIFTDQRNGPVDVPNIPVLRAGQGRPTRTLQVLRLAFGTPTTNHFFAAGTFSAGRWDFRVAAMAGDGTQLAAEFALTVA